MNHALELVALRSAAAGAIALAFGAAPLGVLMIARRLSLMGDALSHGVLPGIAIAFLLAGPNPVAMLAGALIAGLVVGGLSSLLARTGKLPDDAAFAVFYLPALALGMLLLGRAHDPEAVQGLLFGASTGMTHADLLLAGVAASATLLSLALFLRLLLGEGADPEFMKTAGPRLGGARLLLMLLLALNLVAGFRAFGALMTVALMTIPAAAARYWARGFLGQAMAAVSVSAASGLAGLALAAAFRLEPGAVMALSAGALFAASALVGPCGGLLQTLVRRPYLGT